MRLRSPRRSPLLAGSALGLALACAPPPPRPADDPPPDPPPAVEAASYAARVPLPSSLTEPRFPHTAIGADEHLAVLSARSAGLLVFDKSGARRAKVDDIGGTGIAASGETLAIATEGALTLLDLDGAPIGEPIPTGASTSVAAHPEGGFVLAYEDAAGTRIDRVDEQGGVTALLSLEGWFSDGWTERPIAVREDGAIGLVLRGEGADQPSTLLGVALTNDVLSESGARHLLVVIGADRGLEQAITYRNFERRSALHGHASLELVVDEVTVGSSVRSAITGEILAEGRVEAQRVAAVIVVGAQTTATLMEGITPLLARDDEIFAMRQGLGGASLELTNGVDVHIPLVFGGVCREFALTATRLSCVCEQPPVPALAAVDEEPDDDVTGFVLSVLREEIDL